MDVFEKYAEYYDRLYQNKDYQNECDLIENEFDKYGAGQIRSLLDLGCGTGGHAFQFAQRGYRVTGVDRSPWMIKRAQRKKRDASSGCHSPDFLVGDIRNIRFAKNFDAVISMFAVISYQIDNSDLVDCFDTARRALKKGGLFVFDAWYGPAVLNLKPQDRYRVVEISEEERILRFAHSEQHSDRNEILVNYHLLHIIGERIVKEIKEQHPMRYLFIPEIELLAGISGFEICHFSSFTNFETPLGENDWNLIAVLRAK